jgi:hypothetical protein
VPCANTAQRLVIFGSYGVRVESGEVTVYGATLGASNSISWVHAPQSHALPVIRCTKDATLELRPHPNARELEGLGLLSPLFRKLWWESPGSPSHSEDSTFNETYRIVRFMLHATPSISNLWNSSLVALYIRRRTQESYSRFKVTT